MSTKPALILFLINISPLPKSGSYLLILKWDRKIYKERDEFWYELTSLETSINLKSRKHYWVFDFHGYELVFPFYSNSVSHFFQGTAIGKCPKNKLYRGYIELELQLREFERCRILYEKFLEFGPENCTTWMKVRIGQPEQKQYRRSQAFLFV